MRHLVWIVLIAGLILVPGTSGAQVVNFQGADLAISTVKRENQSTIAGWSMGLRIDSIDLPVGLMLMPRAERWQDKSSVDGFSATQRDMAFGMDGAMRWRWGGFRPYIGGGLAIHFVKTQFVAPGISPTEETDTLFGPSLLLGVQLPTSSWLQPSIEAKYQFVSPVEQFKINWGLGANF